MIIFSARQMLGPGQGHHNQYHEGPPSGNPFDDPFFNNFLKGVDG